MIRKAGKILIAVGLVLILAAGAIFFSYEQEERIAGENAAILAEELSLTIAQNRETQMYAPVEQEAPVGQMPQTELAGQNLVGMLRISSLNLTLPILSDWNYDLLKIAPCRYSGSLQTEDLILLGHNYKEHFGPLRKAEIGAEVEFFDVDGGVHRFTVAQTQVLAATELDKLASADHSLSIFTCTRDGESRLVLRCIKKETP